MFKFLIFVTLLALAAAKPAEEGVKKRSTYLTDAAFIPLATTPLKTATIVHEPTLAKIGDVVHSVPTAISHQSSTIVHDRANVVTPIVAPAVKTRLAPVVTDYNLPLLRSYPYQYSYPYYTYYY